MAVTRRSMMALSATAALFPRYAFATTQMKIGSIQLDTLSDGHLTVPPDFLLGGFPEAELDAVLAGAGVTRDNLKPPCNVTLLRDGTRTILFDVGAGADFMPSTGLLSETLDTLGVPADSVTDVVFTHGHPDHLWGVLDDFDDPLFANATYHIGREELDYWMDPDTVNTIGEARTTMAVGAARRLEAISDNIHTFADGQEILPGVLARASFGHTPGHMAFVVHDGADSCVLLGDAVANHYVALARPDWEAPNDQDPALAAATRLSLLDQIATDGLPVIGFHLPDGGAGRIERNGAGYRFSGDM